MESYNKELEAGTQGVWEARGSSADAQILPPYGVSRAAGWAVSWGSLSHQGWKESCCEVPCSRPEGSKE